MGLFNRIFKRKKGEAAPVAIKEKDLKGLSGFEAALKKVTVSATTKNRRDFSSALLETKFYVPLPEKGDENIIKLSTPKKTRIDLRIVKDEDGKTVLPVFTRREFLEKEQPDAEPLAVQSKDIMAMLEKGGIDLLVINPDSPLSGEIKASDIDALVKAAGLGPKESKVSLLVLQDESVIHVSEVFHDLTGEQYDYLKEVFPNHPEVLSAYVFTGIFDYGKPQDVLGVCFSGNKMKALSILQSISPGLSKILKDDQKVNFLGFMEGPLVEQVESIISPFYKK